MGVNFSGWGGLNFSAKTPKRDPEFLILEPRYGVFRRLRYGSGSSNIVMDRAMEKLKSGAILLNLDDILPVSFQECREIY